MKDLVIKAATLRRECGWFAAMFVVAVLINAAAIYAYERPWIELFSQIGFTLCIGLALYLLAWIPRGVIRVVRCVFCRCR